MRPENMIYFSGCIVNERHEKLGFIITPDMGNRIPANARLAVDNGRFTNPDGYSDKRYIRHLYRFPRDLTVFATAPDVVGDHNATVDLAKPALRMIRDIGLPAAFVAQDGWTEETTPWDEFDAIFIGGSTEFKFRGGREAVRAAKKRKKWAHMGRVNSFERLRAAKSIGCDSADGTYLRFGPDINVPKLLRWLDILNSQMEIIL